MTRKLSIAILLACGISAACGSPRKFLASTNDWRIVGGVEAIPHEFPWVVTRGGCGAAVIDKNWVMTAAHCSGVSKITAGEHDLYKNEGTEQTRRVTRTVRHPLYNQEGAFTYDIALHELKEPLVFNEYVQPLKLATRDFNPTGNATVAGWGSRTPWFTAATDPLYKVTVPIVPNSECHTLYQESGYSIYPDMICAGETGKDSCQGDSGGPMMCETPEGWVSCGIVSWGVGCGKEGYPGVYARTSHFIDWIESVTGINA